MKESELHQKCREMPYAENIPEMEGIRGNILAGILAEMGDITRFDDARKIQKLSKHGLVASSSGRCMDRWDEGSWDTILIDTEGSPP